MLAGLLAGRSLSSLPHIAETLNVLLSCCGRVSGRRNNWTGAGGLTPVYADGKLYVRDVKNRNVVYDSTTGNALGNFSATLIPAVAKSTSFDAFNASLRAFDNASQEFRWVLDMHELVTAPLVRIGAR